VQANLKGIFNFKLILVEVKVKNIKEMKLKYRPPPTKCKSHWESGELLVLATQGYPVFVVC